MAKTILIVEDDATQRVILESFLRKKMNLESYTAENGRKGLEILSQKPKIQLVIMDIEMPIMNGIDTLKEIRKKYPHITVIMISGSEDTEQAVQSIQLGAADYIKKPYENERLIITIQNVMKMQRMGIEITRLKHNNENQFQFSDMIGHDGGLENTITLGRKAAMVDLPTLITGETGTGKELFAKAIHGESHKAGAPFIAVNCGAIPTELVESTLFGHEKGAFTGATEAAIGKFREADGGTLFLDEIGDLPLDAQVKLLRVLQENEVEPVGAARSIKVNVRIIAATHRDLEKDIQKGLFREDLFYRLNVLQIKIPALRERPNDIPALINCFMSDIATRSNMPIKTVNPKALNALQTRQWPGNVRELENSLHRAFILSNNQELQISDFPLQKRLNTTENTPETRKINQQSYQTIAEMEKEMILNALKTYNNNMTQAAKSLGLAKSTLYRKVREHINV